ncbi:hypothetical protein ACRE_046250 [Hapsidospora chrysogenum ATCC 11550]|uniref:Uncharacterized protein n=1 Tax=Hapsidospora chrysogenum (strain ATCC 11550 / CBS 779.69 / DSM 880 / IAM 14645 / JCM 23072 / IMI 49137) TaxID=857340 RepID=A0A086T5D9_HAPC1|nr:hypothetical protein ACRE_046250 [Hapsidospora chrysogenum ATCC 11550]
MPGNKSTRGSKRIAEQHQENSNKRSKTQQDHQQSMGLLNMPTAVAPADLVLPSGTTDDIFQTPFPKLHDTVHQTRLTRSAAVNNNNNNNNNKTDTDTTAGGNGMAGRVISPYGSTYQHTGGPSPSITNLAAVRNTWTGLKIGGTVPLEQVNLGMPANLTDQQRGQLMTRLQQELKRQEANPPALPPSRIQPLPPKVFTAEYIDITEVPEEEREAAWEKNKKVSDALQQVEKERNNMAAKKSRETRIEALRQTRAILDDKTAECHWMRLKVIELGGDPTEYDNMTAGLREKLVGVVRQQVAVEDQRNAEIKRRQDANRRAERNKLKAERKREKELLREGRGGARSSSPMSMSPPANETSHVSRCQLTS